LAHAGLAFLAIVLPGIGTALGGFRGHREYSRLAKRSLNMAQALRELDQVLEEASTPEEISRVLQDHRKAEDRYPPLWFIEGLAEYWSTSWDAQAEMVMRDAVLNNIAVGLDDMYLIYGSFLMYKEGQTALRYLSRTYGEEKILLLLENLWKEASFSAVMKLEPFQRGMKELAPTVWITALRKVQNPNRAELDIVSEDKNFKSLKVSPVFYWSDTEMEAYLKLHNLPNEWDYFDPAKADDKRECGLHAAWGGKFVARPGIEGEAAVLI